MKNQIAIIGLAALLAVAPASFAKQSEADLLAMLHSGDYFSMCTALETLPNAYPNSTNAVASIKGILRSNEVLVVTKKILGTEERNHAFYLREMPHVMTARAAVRSLGEYHATINDEELAIINTQLLHSRDEEAAMDGLKGLRGMKAPQAVPMILPLLEDHNAHVARDAIRTLAVLGDKSVIPYLTPLLHHPVHADIGWDAAKAISKLSGVAEPKSSGRKMGVK